MVNLCEDEFRTYDSPHGTTAQRTRGAVLAGPRAQSTVIDTAEQRCLVEVNFEPGGAAPFFGVPLSEARDRLVELEELWGRDGAVLRERLLEAAAPEQKLQILETTLLDHVVGRLGLDPAIAVAAAALERGVSVSAVTSGLGLLPKRFVRRFGAQVGLTPKRFSRVRRLQRLLAAIELDRPVDWAEVAAEHGFYDQAHLVNDFRELTGVTPTAYQPRSATERNHTPAATPAG
jgi:AraC-like DNA-binding protein